MEQREDLRKKGICFRCRKGRHLSSQCPYAFPHAIPPPVPETAQVSSAQGPRVSEATAILSPQKKPTAAKPAESSSFGRPLRPPQRFGTHMVEDEHISVTPQEQHERSMPVTDSHLLLSAPVQSSFKTNIIAEDKTGRQAQLLCLIDTGSQCSEINEEYLKALGFSAEKSCSPKVVRVANGAEETCDRQVELKLQILPTAPQRRVIFHVSKNIPCGNFALLGIQDLQGYTLQISDPPLIEWHAERVIDDQMDPIDVPAPVSEEAHSLPSVDKSLPEYQQNLLTELLGKYSDVFGGINEQPANFIPYHVKLTPGAMPVKIPPRYIPLDRRDFVRKEINTLLQLGVIRPSKSPWSSPILVVVNHSGKKRLCIDYTKVNQLTVKDSFPIPVTRDVMQFVANKPYLASFDLVKGYYQVELDEESKSVLAFVTMDGCYEPNRLMFGPTNGPPHFQRAMNIWLKDQPYARAFIDDCVVAASDFKSFHSSLESLFSRCKMDNIKLNAGKSVIGPPRLHILGRVVGPKTIQVDPGRLEALKNLKPPTTKTTLHSFLGLAQWYSMFIPNYSKLTEPLWDLMKQHIAFTWTEAQQQAWQAVIQAIIEAPALVHVIPGAPLRLHTDASSHGIGGVLLQWTDGSWQPLAFYSRKLSSAEQKYSTYELEALAIVHSLDKARAMIAGPLTIMTDHSNLQFMARSSNLRVQRWKLFMGELDYTVEYHPGSQNAIADYLSRAWEPNESVQVSTHMATSADTPDNIQTNLAHQVRQLPHKLRAHGVIWLETTPPKHILDKIFALAHEDILSGHMGQERTIHRISSAIRWMGMHNDIARLVSLCPICQKVRAIAPHPDHMLSTMSNYPFESVLLDFIGPLRENEGKKYILVCIDRFSRYLNLFATESTAAVAVATNFFQKWICTFGIPALLTTDGGSSFTARMMKELIDILKIEHHISAAYHPQGHGTVERANYSIMQTLRAVFAKNANWTTLLKPVEFALNTAHSRMLGTSPFQVVHGFEPRLLLQASLQVQSHEGQGHEPSEFAKKLIAKSMGIFDKVKQISQQIFEKELQKIRRKAHGQVDFEIGNYVLIHYPRPDKISMQWKGPFIIVKRENSSIYHVQDLEGQQVDRVHVNRLHIFYPGTLTPNQLRAEAADQGEYYIEKVFQHEKRQGELWFLVKWLGYEYLGGTDEDSWVRYSDCRQSPQIKEYMRCHSLRVRSDALACMADPTVSVQSA